MRSGAAVTGAVVGFMVVAVVEDTLVAVVGTPAGEAGISAPHAVAVGSLAAPEVTGPPRDPSAERAGTLRDRMGDPTETWGVPPECQRSIAAHSPEIAALRGVRERAVAAALLPPRPTVSGMLSVG